MKNRLTQNVFGNIRSIYVSSLLHKEKKHKNPEEEVIVNKTNQRSTNKNKKHILERKIKPKRTVWGVIDIYRFITVEKLASLMEKSVGKCSMNRKR